MKKGLLHENRVTVLFEDFLKNGLRENTFSLGYTYSIKLFVKCVNRISYLGKRFLILN